MSDRYDPYNEIEYPDMPKITGRVIFQRIQTKEGILYKAELEGGDVIGVTLQLLMEFQPDLVSIWGDFITIGTLEFIILGYKSHSILILKYIGTLIDTEVDE